MSAILYPIAFIYTLVRGLWSTTNLSKYFLDSALSIDKTGSIWCQYLFNDIMVKPDGYRHGASDADTASKVFGKNKQFGKQYNIGEFVANVLNRIDKNHVEKAAKK